MSFERGCKKTSKQFFYNPPKSVSPAEAPAFWRYIRQESNIFSPKTTDVALKKRHPTAFSDGLKITSSYFTARFRFTMGLEAIGDSLAPLRNAEHCNA